MKEGAEQDKGLTFFGPFGRPFRCHMYFEPFGPFVAVDMIKAEKKRVPFIIKNLGNTVFENCPQKFHNVDVVKMRLFE